MFYILGNTCICPAIYVDDHNFINHSAFFMFQHNNPWCVCGCALGGACHSYPAKCQCGPMPKTYSYLFDLQLFSCSSIKKTIGAFM